MSVPAPGARRWSFGRIALLGTGAVGVLLALGLLTAGVGLLWAHQTQRDDDGYLSTGSELFRSNSFAIRSASIDADAEGADWLFSQDVLGKIRVRVEEARGEDVFVGVGPTADVDEYLSEVEYDQLEDIEVDPFRAEYRRHPGGAPQAEPGEQAFWAASASGPGEQTLTWTVEQGDWSVVVMNADAREGIAVDASAGAEAGFLAGLAVVLLVAGTLILIGSSSLVYLGARGATAEPYVVPGAALPATAPTVYPVGVRGDPDRQLSRWLWLVKWILAIPHYIVLAFLWLVFFALSAIAFFAILFTARYPRGIFDFNVGVLRWTWRVMFYSYWALGTDRYPPFTLDAVPDYPATLEVAYPERLSRGLVLVKWWLLALPHYFVVAVFVGGWAWGPLADEPFRFASFGLVGILVLIGGFALLFTGRFPPGLRDFVLGLDRWVLRVAVYAGLMRDEYPPFRLDPGPREPEAQEAETASTAEPRT